MAAPIITIWNTDGQQVASWDCGTVQANNYSAVLSLKIWNNKSGASDVSDLQGVSITTLDIDGGSSSDVVAGKWVQVNVPAMDGENVWSSIGGTTVKSLRADALSGDSGYIIRGTQNDGTSNATTNYCTVNLKAHVPLNATPGTKTWKTRINGYYV